MTKVLRGTKADLLPIAHECLALGFPLFVREIEIGLYEIEIPLSEIAALDTVHVAWLMRMTRLNYAS